MFATRQISPSPAATPLPFGRDDASIPTAPKAMIERAFAAHRGNPIIQNIYDTRRLLNAIPQCIEVISRTVHSSAQGAEHTCARKLGPSHPVAMQNHSHSPLRLLQLRGLVFSPPSNMQISLPILMLGPRLLLPRRRRNRRLPRRLCLPSPSFPSLQILALCPRSPN